MDAVALKASVTNLLVSTHDFDISEAEEIVTSSFADNPHLWSENADPNDLANFLASDGDDD